MLHANHPSVKEVLFKGNFGLEKESLRIDKTGHLAHTDDPFEGEAHIVRDFCENQVEINTSVQPNVSAVVEELRGYHHSIIRRLAQMETPEYLWPFSNPPYIMSEKDIPVAQFGGSKVSKMWYREYLSDRYGRYKMTFSGIHFNFSFADELLEADFALSEETDFQKYKNDLYVTLAERVAAYGWIMVAITAASPLLDSSFVEKGRTGQDVFNGMGSVRCSETGYWNFFTPVFDYSDVEKYADSIQKLVDERFIGSPSELYYPVRLKSEGVNNLEVLREKGVNHIELRMIDLNPYADGWVDERDIAFAHLLLVWLASTPRQPFDHKDQVQAVQNFKNAAHYDLKTVKIVVPNGEIYSVANASLKVIGFMKDFFRDASEEIHEILDYQEKKFTDPDNYRYAWRVRRDFGDGFVEKGLRLAIENAQKELETEP